MTDERQSRCYQPSRVFERLDAMLLRVVLYIFGLPHRPDPAANSHVHQWDRGLIPRLFFTVKGFVPKVSLICDQEIAKEDFVSACSARLRFATKLGGLGRILRQSMLIITITLAGTPMVYTQAGSSTLLGRVNDAS